MNSGTDKPSETFDSMGLHSSMIGGLAGDDLSRFEESYYQLVDRHSEHVFNWFQTMTFLDQNSIDDIAQDFFVSLKRKMLRPKSRKKLKEIYSLGKSGKKYFKRWLYVIARNSTKDFLRQLKNRIKKERPSDLTDLEAQGDFHQQIQRECHSILVADFHSLLNQIQGKIVGCHLGKTGQVSVKDWQVFLARQLSRSSEVAEQFQKTKRSVEQSVYRVNLALNKLRPELIQEFGFIGFITDHQSESDSNLSGEVTT